MPTALQSKGTIGKIISHPIRVQCLIALTERKASVAQLARDFDVDPGALASHVKKLLEAGSIELVEVRKNNGARERFYKAVERPEISDEESDAMSREERIEWCEHIVALIMADLSLALPTTLAERPDHAVIRFPTLVDEQGFKDLSQAAGEFLERAYDVEAESAGRMVESGEKAIPTRVMGLVFEVPRPS
jgi:DNA-binding transcriptional ArsR family regulator